VQTLTGKAVDGQFHEITSVSYDDKGKRAENVTFAEQSTLRGIVLSPQDMDDIRIFMPWILTTEEIPQYNLTYAGQQHVDDLDTYVFHVEPKKEEKGKKEEGKKEEAPKHHARELGPTELEEFELGEFMVSIPHSAASSTSIVTFKLYGTIQHKNLDYVTDHFEQVKNRLHDSIETIIRSSETEDLSHPGLDLIKRKIFETSNKTLGTKPVLKGVIFNGYMYYDQ